MNGLEDLIEKLKLGFSHKDTFLIAIDGIGGSGKSTVALKLAEAVGARIIATDAFYSKDTEEHDVKKLHEAVLDAKNEPGITIIEGIYSMNSNTRDLYDYKIWVECEPKVALERGIKRSGEQEREIWTNVWQPNELTYVKAENSSSYADLVLDTTKADLQSFHLADAIPELGS